MVKRAHGCVAVLDVSLPREAEASGSDNGALGVRGSRCEGAGRQKDSLVDSLMDFCRKAL